MNKTLGALTIDEKGQRFKAGKKWHPFSALMSYKVRVDNVRERTGGVLRILGARTSSSASKLVTHKLDIVLTMDSLDEPIITIPIIKKPLGGKAYDKAMKMVDETKAGLEYISRHKNG